MMDQKARCARKLVVPDRHDDDIQFFPGKVSAGKFYPFGRVAFIHVNARALPRGARVGSPSNGSEAVSSSLRRGAS